MATGLLPEKVIGDLQECICKLVEDFTFSKIPINDDNTNLHRFCSKLEFLLQNGMKDHGNLLRKRKEYWDYFCHCLTTSRGNVHDGLKFVKSHPELKTSLARGRAFIRFCLVRQCLADTLQSCFMNEKVTSSFYYERSVLRQEAQLSPMLSSLYELNEIQFDLSPRGHDLDMSWPTFARKLFDSSHLWQPPSRSVSISSLSSCVSQNDSTTMQLNSSKTPSIKEIQELRTEIERLENSMEELKQKLDRSEQQEEYARLLADERQQHLIELTKQLEGERKLHKISISNLEENTVKLQNEWQQERNQLTENLSVCVETSKEHTEKLNRVSQKFENKDKDCRELQAKIINLEEENNSISSHSLQLEKDLKMQQEHLQIQMNKSGELDKLVLELKNENEALKHQIKESASSQISSDEAAAQSCTELTEKLEATEASLLSTTSEKEGLHRSLGKVEHINSILQKLVNTVERENTKLKEQLAIVESNLAYTQVNLEKCQAVKTDLESEIYEMRTELKNVRDKSNETVKELEASKKLPIELITALEKVIWSINSDSLQLIERLCYSWIVDYKLREKINSFVAILRQRTEQQRTDGGVDIVQQSTDNCCSSLCNMQDAVSDLYKKEATLINELQKELDGCLQETLKLSCQMCVLKDMLHLDHDKGNISPLGDLVDNTESSGCDNDGIPTVASSVGNVLLDEANNNTNKLSKLTVKAQKLCHNLEAFRLLNHCLIAKVQDQERKLSGIAQELEATQKLVSSLKLEHNKLQTSEAITRYELKEKRKLLTRLRTQLESTREDWHRMRKNYSDSEAEWQSLRAEFAKRHKQASEESGFIDCGKNFEENEVVDGGIEIPTASSPIDISESSPRDDSMMTDCSVQLSSSCEGAEGGKIEETTECAMPKTRLELLEEECKLLYQSLVNSATKSDNLEQRVQSLAYISAHSRHRKSSATYNPSSSQHESSDCLAREPPAVDDNESRDNILLDNSCSTVMEDAALLDNSLPENELHETSEEAMDDVAEQSTEENELNLPTAGNYSDSNSSTDEEDNAIQEEAEEELHYLRRQALHGFVHRFLGERNRHKAEEAELNSKIEALQKANSKLEEELEKLRQERNELLTRETNFRKRTEYIFRKERKNFNVQLDNFEAERSKLHKNFEKLTVELEEASDKIKELENRLHQTTEELNTVRQVKDEEVSALQFQLSTESLKCGRALKLDELQLSLSTRDEECTKLNEDLKKIVMELDKEKQLSNQLQAEVQETKEQNKRMISQRTSELSEIKNDNVELKKNLVRLIREKDKLWKHSERLSHQQKIQVTDRWMEDAETNNCLGCQVAFSFTVRKHHCRLCGRIFCHSCSNNWLLIASSRSQARICNECFLRHIKLQTEAGNVCTVTNMAEDSEDDCETGIPIASSSHSERQHALSANSSSDPENQLPESVSSCPISSPELSAVLESEAMPMYGSVPDLPSFCASRRNSHDNRLIQESRQRRFLGMSEGFSKQPLAHNPYAEFDVISDEEIAHSLSSYNPYIETTKAGNKTDSRLHTTITRTAASIAATGLTGVSGELWVNAGTQYGVPVVCDDTGVLHWEFSTEPQRIAFSVAYKKSNTNTYNKFEMQPLLHTTHVNSSQHCVKGHVVMKNLGVYVLLFDNRFSRIAAKKVKYLLWVNNVEECAASTCKENFDQK